MSLPDSEDIEINLLLEALFLKYGYDFRNYARASLRRRVLHALSMEGLQHVSEMQHRLLNDLSFCERLVLDLTVNVSEMFRDPSFYLALRREVIPALKSYPFLRIWLAGMATGEEVYSVAILLKEEGLYERSKVYATDINEVVLQKARQGIFPVDSMRTFTKNYQRAGGRESFSNYYTANYNSAIMDRSLKEHVTFASHNLATDSGFGEMHLILCRNVLIYFDRELQDRVLCLFRDSLCDEGFLCLGTKETIEFSQVCDDFHAHVPEEKIYGKKEVS
ncbi:MAG: protein-glutamate O-methyltransferase CheR [Thermodesulfobacteriota bacterium]|nr:protein-glutamate O-methyltransferase CheR [Thermodesulfobacteriota bacterium]